jgi:hypothetical protein
MIMWNGQEAYLCVDPQAYLERCERKWEQDRYFPAVGYAVMYCSYNGLPLPEWLVDLVNHAMLIAFEHGGRTTNRRAGGYKPQARRLEVHESRWAVVRAYKQLQGMTDDEAFERASEDLRGTAAQCEPRPVKDSYRAIQKQLKAGTAKSRK